MADEQMKGIPDGVKVVENYFASGPNDFELMRQRSEADPEVIIANIYKGCRPGSATGIKVLPLDGWTFIHEGWEMIFDPFAYKNVQARPRFVATKLIAPKTVTVSAKFQVTNERDLTALEKALEESSKGVAAMPGFVEQSRVDA